MHADTLFDAFDQALKTLSDTAPSSTIGDVLATMGDIPYLGPFELDQHPDMIFGASTMDEGLVLVCEDTSALFLTLEDDEVRLGVFVPEPSEVSNFTTYLMAISTQMRESYLKSLDPQSKARVEASPVVLH